MDQLVLIENNTAFFSNRLTIDNELFPPNIIHVTDDILFYEDWDYKISSMFYLP